MKSVFKKLVSFEEAVKKAYEFIPQINDTEMVDLLTANGRILAEDIFSPVNNPPFNRSTMDGYAVRSTETAQAAPESPAKLKVSGSCIIGEPQKFLQDKNTCYAISTGSIVPGGSDSVVMVEHTIEAEGTVMIQEAVTPGQNIAETGSDVATGEIILFEGKELETNDLAVLASLGISHIRVYRRLKIAIISTGNELIMPGEKYTEGKIHEANGIAVLSEISKFRSLDPEFLGIVPDRYELIKRTIVSATENHDVVILSGGSSAGSADMVYRIIEQLNPGLIFHGVLVKPGSPTAMGRHNNTVIIGLPGFPVSSLMIFRTIFLEPIINASRSLSRMRKTRKEIGQRINLEMGKQNLFPVRQPGEDKERIYPVTGLSGSISRFTATDGFISLPGNTKFIESGTPVEMTMWEKEAGKNGVFAAGMLLSHHSNTINSRGKAMTFLRMNPRDAIRSYTNGDIDLAIIYSTVDNKSNQVPFLGDFKSSEEDCLFIGKPIKIVAVSQDKSENFDTVISKISDGTVVSGPPLRLLSNILTDNLSLISMCSTIRNNISQYYGETGPESMKGLSEGRYPLVVGNLDDLVTEGYELIELFTVAPVFIFGKNNLAALSCLNTGEISPLKQ